MMQIKKLLSTIWLALLCSLSAHAATPEIDVISYHLTIMPDIDKKEIKGTVVIRFKIDKTAKSITLNSGNLQVEKVTGDHLEGFQQNDGHLIIELSAREITDNEIIIDYHGSPTYGLYFNPAKGLAHTVYSTSQWMVCNDAPADKALFHVNITVPADKSCVASGELISRKQEDQNMVYSFQQNFASPAYTYGFAIGDFNYAEEKHKEIQLQYYGTAYSPEQLKAIFRETPNMISFFEEKSGVSYYQSTYAQILIGDHYQEMSGFATLMETYGNMVLNDSVETNLISHELAHQWWGNRLTCKNWNHFWLNEAMSTFMSAAYNEERFGREVYLSNINAYYKVYEAIKKRGNDKALVFPNWRNPSRDDRNLVYFKGAYVLHLLKEELGEETFWQAIKDYTINYFGQSVETADFQKAIETSANIDLSGFFNEWVYHKTK